MLTVVSPSHATPSTASIEQTLLRDILRQVSRSFYLSLIVLPKPVRQQVSLAYLFCRAADTIADTGLFPRHQRLQALDIFRRQFVCGACNEGAFDALNAMRQSNQVQEGERQLFDHLPDCFRMFASLSPMDQQLIRELVLTLTRGMQMDLRYFPGDTASTARALPDMHALDLYTYYVAGVVGEFWTRIHLAHLPALQGADSRALCPLAVSFGKGLQLTNILKDLGKDLHHGRCYVPEKRLKSVQLRVEDLEKPGATEQLQPLIQALAWYTLDHLDRACQYVRQLPRRALRLRLGCMWPLLFAVQTLDVVCQSERLLQPSHPVKISRRAVYRTMFGTLWCLAWPGLFMAYYGHLRRRLITTLSET